MDQLEDSDYDLEDDQFMDCFERGGFSEMDTVYIRAKLHKREGEWVSAIALFREVIQDWQIDRMQGDLGLQAIKHIIKICSHLNLHSNLLVWPREFAINFIEKYDFRGDESNLQYLMAQYLMPNRIGQL